MNSDSELINNVWNGCYHQEKVVSVLNNIFQSGKIPHAFLFVGPEGVGKHNTALKFAKLLNYNYPADKQRNILHKIDYLLEPYIKFIIPLPTGKKKYDESAQEDKQDYNDKILDHISEEISKKIKNPFYKLKIEDANNIRIDSIREINRTLSINYDDIKYRIILISQAELMNNQAQNALLKNLEEPPQGVIFVLLTSNINKLLPTIISRCWSIQFNNLSNDDVKNILIQNFKIEEQLAKDVSVFSNGSVSIAIDLIEKDIYNLIEKTIFIIRYSVAKKYFPVLQELTDIKEYDENNLRYILQFIIMWFSDALKLRYNQKAIYFKQNEKDLQTFNERRPNANLNQLLTNLQKFLNLLDTNVNLNTLILNIIFELALISITE
ncbi:MAG: hypothetical protein JXA68_05340 [Ignavibacteriales bacterium]|nr:hypothetical protein [Ignavibacteriales bacterium]